MTLWRFSSLRPACVMLLVVLFAVMIGGAAEPRSATNRASGDHRHPPVVTDQELKTVYLLNLARFVTWPTGTFDSPDEPIVIGVTDPDWIEEAGPLIRDETAQDRPIAFRVVRKAYDAMGCHLLYLNGSDARLTQLLLDTYGRRPVLTVGERRDFTLHGGIVRFLETDGHVHLTINLANAKTAGLSISAQLLEVARVEGADSTPRGEGAR